MAEPEDQIDIEFRKVRRAMNAFLAKASREGRLADVLLKMEQESLADWKGRILRPKALPPLPRRRKKA